jgi:predicted ATP-dependent endonuclease of OLD family
MKFNISISNFGKINNADIKIRPFTVIAGPNSSGKSFVTKALYSFFSTINIDHVTVETFSRTDDLQRLATYLNATLPRPSSRMVDALYKEFVEKINVIEGTIEDAFEKNTFSDQVSRAFLLKEAIDGLEKSFNNLNSQVSNKAKYSKVTDQFDNIKNNINQLKKIADNPSECLSSGINTGFINALKENFQVSSLTDLKNYHVDNDSIVKFNFDTLGSIEIKKETLSFSLNRDSIDEFQNLYNVVYIESPVYWKMKEALESVRKNKRFFSISRIKQADYLTGVPKHFYDLVDFLKNKTKNSENIKLEQSVIKTAIGGEIIISESGELYFKEDGYTKNINLHATALGVTNLGIISLLLERGILAKGSYLFVDEPEVHLHPSWQKIMIDTLFELSKKEINIVIASHSIDMMKCIENIMEQEESLNLDEHFGINQLSSEGNSLNGSDNVFKRISAIKEDLGKSFYEMFIDSKWE